MVNSRKLGAWEQLHAMIHDQADGHGIIVCSISVFNDLNPVLIKQALHLIYQKHPLLRSQLANNEAQHQLSFSTPFNQIPFSVVEKTDSEEWKHLVEEELAKKIKTSSHLWRIKLLLPTEKRDNNTEIVATFSHVICDGLSIAAFFKDLLAFYGLLERGEMPLISSLASLPPVDLLLRKRGERRGVFSVDEQNKLSAWSYLKKTDIKDRKTKNVYRRLSEDVMERLKKQCQTNRVSVNSALNSAMMKAAYQKKKSPIMLALQTPIDLRRYCDPMLSNKDFGCYVSIIATRHTVEKDSDFWTLARDYRQQCKESIREASFLFGELHADLLINLINEICLGENNRFTLGFGVTYSGEFNDGGGDEEHKIRFAYGCTSRQAGDFVILLLAAVANKQLFLTFNYTYPLLSEAWVEDFADDFINSLLDASSLSS